MIMAKSFMSARPLRRLMRRFNRNARGVSAVEFALILPVMIALLFATAETTQGLQADRKASLAARALSDLSSQSSVITDADMNNILDATGKVLAPFSVSNAKVIVTGITIDVAGRATADWSAQRNWTCYPRGTNMTVPSGLMPPTGTTGYLVLAEVQYRYTPAVAWFTSGTITLSDKLYTRPRLGDTIARQGSTCQ